MIPSKTAALRGAYLSIVLLLAACVTTAPPHVKALAEAGNAEAQNSMGSYAQEAGRYEEARGWYEKAAEQNHDLALNSLGYLYDFGLSVPKDWPRAFEYYTRAANLGEPEAMWNIANMYGAGQLGPKDMHMACIWVFRANRFAAPGSRVEKPAQQGVAYLRRSLSVNDLRRCIAESSNWSPANQS